MQGDFGLHNQNFSKYLHHPTSNDITQVNLIYDLEFTFSDTYFGNTDGEYGLLNTQITITETNSVVLLYSCLSTGSTERSVNSDKNTYANGVINFHIGSLSIVLRMAIFQVLPLSMILPNAFLVEKDISVQMDSYSVVQMDFFVMILIWLSQQPFVL